MNIIMNNISIESIAEMKEFLQVHKRSSFSIKKMEDRYKLISDTLVKFKYKRAEKKDKGVILKYLLLLTGYSDIQMKRLVKIWKKEGLVVKKRGRNKGSFQKKYGACDISLLVKTDTAHKTINGKATKKILEREYSLFGKNEYEKISKISVSHIYNIRNNSRQYLSSKAIQYSKTNPTGVNIGERRKPFPNGEPGFLRVDTVHQGDLDKEKGVYHVNIVDEVTQWELVGCVKGISEYFLKPLLEELLDEIPFEIINFHSDNGSEYINKTVAKLLNKLAVKQTKSRSRHSNDNALVEGKNASRIRKHMGKTHIQKKHADIVNDFYFDHFNNYMNYHRPCAFSEDHIDKNGKIKKVYKEYLTPYEKLKFLEDAKQYLKEGVSFEELDEIAYAESDNESAEKMRKAKFELFKSFKN